MKLPFGLKKSIRLGVVLLLLLGLGGAAVARIGYLDVTGDFLRKQGDARTVRTEITDAHRGTITDRRGELLAVSTPVESIWIDPSDSDPQDPKFVDLAQLLKMQPQALRARVEANRKYEFLYLRRQVDPELAGRVRALHIRGIGYKREYKRYYPAGEIVSHVVGLTNIEDHGADGVELAFDNELQGTQGKKRVLKDRNGTKFRDLEFLQEARPGRDLPLSIDLRLQYLAYRELKRAVVDEGASAASLVMLDARSGEVLALVNQPSFNPNRELPANSRALRDRAANDRFEPGSTMKPFAMTAALETGTVRVDTLVDTNPGSVYVGGKRIEDPHNNGVISLGQILAYSSQVGISKIALQLPAGANMSVLQRVGLMETTGAHLPGEVAGRMPRNPNSLLGRATLAYGYGLSITPLQLARAYSVFASGGILRPVTLVHRDVYPQGVRVLDARVAAQVSRLLEGVIGAGGTAPLARVPGYRIAGKTGTVRKVGAGGYESDRHVAFFAGFAPATAPRIVIVVVVDEPAGKLFHGGDVAAPVFGRVAAETLRLLEIPPDGEIADWGGTV